LFKAGRTDKVEIYEKVLNQFDKDRLWEFQMYLKSKDPEHRNVIVLCLINSSVNVLKAIYETFKDSIDMSELILK
jgi:hypothetical protein